MLAAACDRLEEATPETSVRTDVPIGRLPRSVLPRQYRLDLTIVPDLERFSGQVEIDVTIAEPVDGIWLHGRNLSVERADLITVDGQRIAATYAQVNADGVARVTLDEPVEPQQATLTFTYDAPFGESLSGLYKVSVGEDDYAFTQLESIAARRVFPGFDEPAFKTPFAVTLTTRASYRALGNTSVTRTETLPEGMQRLTYAKTLPLPTYLMAFAVGPLDVVEWAPVPASGYRARPLPLRGAAARGQGDRLAFALENTAPLVVALEGYFASPYPFDKLDIVAVPDFSGGAMENAGLITYRESILLFDDNPPVRQERFFGLIHAHELSHQWFGNLVTMPWWDDIWLNEAFASWMQAKIGQSWRPAFHFERDVQASALWAMRNDSLASARQIREPVETKDDITSAFDSITYQKGAAVLQMLERYLGEESFQAAIREHLERHEFGTATVYDLMDSLENVAGKDSGIRAAFESFLFQPGVPYLSLALQCDADGARVALSQERYLPVGSTGDRDMTWRVPVCLAYGTETGRHEQCVLLTTQTAEYPLPSDGSCPAWVMPNAGGAGYYRWSVDGGLRKGLADVFSDGLTAPERLSYVDSLVSGVNNGALDMRTFLEDLPVIAAASERNVVLAPVDSYRQLVGLLLENDSAARARAYATKVYAPRLSALENGEISESAAEADLLRAQLIRFLAVELGEESLRERLRADALRYLGFPQGREPDRGALDPNLLTTALIVSVQEGDGDFIDFFLGYFRASLDARFRQSAVSALAHARDPELLERIRVFALGPDVRANELRTWLRDILNPASQAANWPWVQSEIDAILEAGSDRVRLDAPVLFGAWLCSEVDAQILESLFSSRMEQFNGSPRRLDQALEGVRLCAALKEAQGESARRFFSEEPT
jgi:alanyl aminopeptidase